jgi:hypothetical protein
MTVESLGMAYRSFREVLAGLTPASIPRLQRNVVTQIPSCAVRHLGEPFMAATEAS